MFSLFTFTFASDGFNAKSPSERKPVSDTNQLGSVSDVLVRLAAAGECMASIDKTELAFLRGEQDQGMVSLDCGLYP